MLLIVAHIGLFACWIGSFSQDSMEKWDALYVCWFFVLPLAVSLTVSQMASVHGGSRGLTLANVSVCDFCLYIFGLPVYRESFAMCLYIASTISRYYHSCGNSLKIIHMDVTGLFSITAVVELVIAYFGFFVVVF